MQADTPKQAPAKSTARSAVTNGTKIGNEVDGRSVWARRLRDLIEAYTSDLIELEHVDELSHAKRSLVRRAAVLTVELERAEADFAKEGAADLAQLNLKRLVNIPLGVPVRLTTPLEIPTPEQLAQPELDPEVVTRQKATVSATAEQVAIQAENVRVANSARLPSLSLQMAYGGQAFPSSAFKFSGANWQPDWTATLGFSVPLFTGFEAESAIARARLAERQAELQLVQVREAVELQYQQARGEKERARASIGARQRTVEQAQRVYDLTVLRYGQGQSTQLEVSQARLELLQARSNLAQAIADFYLAGAGVSNAQAGTTAQTMTPSSTSEQMSGSTSPATSGAVTPRPPTGGTPR